MKLTLGFSPCPNDTFIFDALVNKKIDAAGFEFEICLEDVETLNQWAMSGKLDITKLSFPAFFQSLDNYVLMESGSALGKGVGPLLIQNSNFKFQDVKEHSVALPGIHTTAHLLFSFAYPEARHKEFMIFSVIEDAVIKGDTDLGVIIHENRFTYRQRGLQKVRDLGEYWEEKMKVPIPLGGIAIKRELANKVGNQIEKLIRESIEYSFNNRPAISSFVKQHSQTMSEKVMQQHIDLYVNHYSLNLGQEGKNAIEILHQVFLSANNRTAIPEMPLFL